MYAYNEKTAQRIIIAAQWRKYYTACEGRSVKVFFHLCTAKGLGTYMESIPLTYLVISVIGGLLIALALYFRNRDFREHPRYVRGILFALRFLAATLLILLLLEPSVRFVQTQYKKPLLVVTVDNSQSIGAGFATSEDSVNFLKAYRDFIHSLSKDYDVRTYLFGEEIRPEDSIDFRDKRTNIARAISYLQDRYADEAVAAMVFMTDGRFNRGIHPLYALTSHDIPHTIVAMGDTSKPVDLQIVRLFHNNVAVRGDDFVLHADIYARGLKDKRGTASIYTRDGGRLRRIASKPFHIRSDEDFQTLTFELPTVGKGYKQYIVQLSTFEEEKYKANNRRIFYIDIIDYREQVKIIAAAPHPDLGALKSALEKQQNIQVDIGYARNMKWNVRNTDILILHNLPTRRYPLRRILSDIAQHKVPVWVIVGGSTDYNALNAWQSLLQIKPSRPLRFNEVTPHLDPNFSEVHLTEETKKVIEDFPPIYSPFGEYKADPRAAIWMYQKILKVITPHPLMLIGRVQGHKMAVLAGEGIYRWRLYDFARSGHQGHFDEWVQGVVRYLAVKEDKSRFRVRTAKGHIDEGEEIRFIAERYNASMQRDNQEDVSLTLRDTADHRYEFLFTRISDYYEINVGKLSPGHYKWTAQTTLDGKRVQKHGEFTVAQLDIEHLQPTVDLNLLHNWAAATGGSVVFSDQLSTFADTLKAQHPPRPIAHSSIRFIPLIHMKWLLFLLLGLLSLEWILRRFWGRY